MSLAMKGPLTSMYEEKVAHIEANWDLSHPLNRKSLRWWKRRLWWSRYSYLVIPVIVSPFGLTTGWLLGKWIFGG